jgi:hypothetical protein
LYLREGFRHDAKREAELLRNQPLGEENLSGWIGKACPFVVALGALEIEEQLHGANWSESSVSCATYKRCRSCAAL